MSHSLYIAKKIIQKLKDNGYIAYIVGGWVRDFLLGIPSDDIDIATNALPSEIQCLFPQHLEIGTQFGIVLVQYHNHLFEIATFRHDGTYSNGRKPDGVVFSKTPQEDASRRDFTINGMFYDPLEQRLYDFVGGQIDLEKKVIRTIGLAEERFQEDKLRMVRAVRFACKLGFTIEHHTLLAIQATAPFLLPSVSKERIGQEFHKMRLCPSFKQCCLTLHHTTLLKYIFPHLNSITTVELEQRLKRLDLLPSNTPTILLLARLFSKDDTQQVQQLHKELKGSNEEGQWLERYLLIQHALTSTKMSHLNLHAWVMLLAHPKTQEALKVCLNALEPDQESAWKQTINHIEKEMGWAIQRVRSKNPIVSSQDLMALGIRPGKTMGQILQEAEKISINERLQNKDSIIQRLKHMGRIGLHARNHDS